LLEKRNKPYTNTLPAIAKKWNIKKIKYYLFKMTNLK
jgi:hypothetical protein